MTNRPIRHGTAYSYKHRKCRCDECRSAAMARITQYRRDCGVRPISETGNVCEKDGIVYQSQTAAAAALGVSASAITYHLTVYGNLDRIGASRSHSNGGIKKGFAFMGRKWPSRAEFSRYVGLSDPMVRGWIRRGKADRILGALMKADAKAENVKVAA